MNDRVKEITLRWEKLRVAYNLVLLVETLWLLRKCLADALTANWIGIVTAGALANVFYCLGPLLEIYADIFLGRCLGRARYVLFSAGLLFSMWLAWSWAVSCLQH